MPKAKAKSQTIVLEYILLRSSIIYPVNSATEELTTNIKDYKQVNLREILATETNLLPF